MAVSPQFPPALPLLTDPARLEATSLLWFVPELETEAHPTLLFALQLARQPRTLLPRNSPALVSRPSLPHPSLDDLTPSHSHLATPGTHQVGLCGVTTTQHVLSPTVWVVLLYHLVLHPPAALRLEPENRNNYIHCLHLLINGKRRTIL